MHPSAHIDRFVLDRLPPREAWPEFRFDLAELAYPEALNAAVELIDRPVMAGEGGRVAVVNADGAWSYAWLADASARIAAVLARDGLVPGGRVLLRGPNGAMLFACWLGVLKAGGVVVTTMPLLRAGEIGAILDKARIGFALVDSECLGGFIEAAEGRGVRTLTYAGDRGGGVLEARMQVAVPAPPVATRADDPALIAFTSGTTGVPKGCVHDHAQILAPADTFARHLLAPRPGDVFAATPPIAFTFGLGALVIFPLRFLGIAVTLAGGGAAAILDAIKRHRITTLFTAPTAYKAMVGELAGRDLSSLRTCVSAGEHLPEPTWRAWRDATGIAIVNGIGATEMMHIFVSAAGEAIRPGATGRAVPGYEVTVLDENGAPIAEGTGRLAVRGPTGCRYLADARQADYVRNGWNITGDTFRRDAQGYFHYVARSDDMIVSSGYNIAAPEVETALYMHEAVAECAVVGVPCTARGTLVKAFVVTAAGYTGGDALARVLQDHVKAAIAPYKYPREIEFVAALPKTLSGKVRRFALRR